MHNIHIWLSAKRCARKVDRRGWIFLINVGMRFVFFGRPVISHVCVKGLNNNVNSFCTEVEKHTSLTGCRTSAITTQTPHSAATWLLWCSKLYITWMLWALGIWSCHQNRILATDLCMVEVICCNSWCLSCNFSSFFLHNFSHFQPHGMSTENTIQTKMVFSDENI